MVNLVTAYCSLLKWLMKRVGLRPSTVEIEPGTVIRMWVPCNGVSKPAVVLLHGFCGDGMMNWQLQVQALARDYAVYVPDLLFFGGGVREGGGGEVRGGWVQLRWVRGVEDGGDVR
ncbi:hypothetical protein Fmac_002523 [Flemingia macrophylla]|uniref:AB hydrolase-1 domain-containing protein n=1 Tax=Flemingia macrophylla TaxID=520843 RepID=A0ABD1NK63_9FABA